MISFSDDAFPAVVICLAPGPTLLERALGRDEAPTPSGRRTGAVEAVGGGPIPRLVTGGTVAPAVLFVVPLTSIPETLGRGATRVPLVGRGGLVDIRLELVSATVALAGPFGGSDLTPIDTEARGTTGFLLVVVVIGEIVERVEEVVARVAG